MGMHPCEWCIQTADHPLDVPEFRAFPHTSSGDVTLMFENGRMWEMPDMILHYVADHGYQPPREFVYDVMNVKLLGGERQQTRGGIIRRVGYLAGSLEKGPVQEGFVLRLMALMRMAEESGNRLQTKGLR